MAKNLKVFPPALIGRTPEGLGVYVVKWKRKKGTVQPTYRPICKIAPIPPSDDLAGTQGGCPGCGACGTPACPCECVADAA